jgi:hypothetical protein
MISNFLKKMQVILLKSFKMHLIKNNKCTGNVLLQKNTLLLLHMMQLITSHSLFEILRSLSLKLKFHKKID